MRVQKVSSRALFLPGFIISIFLLLTVPGSTLAQNGWEHIILREYPPLLDRAVDYLSRQPKIDGKLDKDLSSLPQREFNDYWMNGKDFEVPPLSYRLAYGADFLYIYIEVESDDIVFNDRAYQNGDGFTLVLTVPREDNAPSDEFYVLACSAVDDSRMDWTRKIFWYYNVDNIFLPVSDDTKVKFVKGKGTVQFELLLDWADVYPYHPWLSDGIGFNLGFTKGIGDDGEIFYRVVDASIGAENKPREYTLLNFKEPVHEGKAVTYLLPDRGHISAGEALQARAVTVSEEPFEERLEYKLDTFEGKTVISGRPEYRCEPGLTYHKFTIGTEALPPGEYELGWKSRNKGSKGKNGLTILQDVDPEVLDSRIEELSEVLSPGSSTTFQFLSQEIAEELESVYPYEQAGDQGLQYVKLFEYLAAAEQGKDTFSEERGLVRMAYRSALDNSLQPYVVYIPEDYDPARKYPLLVYLHGSASTERNIIGTKSIPDGFIALGPKGRGPSNWYSWDDAQVDIAEAIESVKSNFSIDDKNIVLAGFSMGGYGVYRTFYEHPETYSALVVFSGSPHIRFGAPEGMSLIDFTDEKNLESFKDIHVFIFHGARDKNVPFEDTEQFIEKLEGAGAHVEFYVEKDKGHEPPNEKTIKAFHKWIKEVAN